MTHTRAILALVSLLAATSLNAELPAGDVYVITKSTIDNGGGFASGGNFALTGTIGQPDASTSPASGGNFSVSGGFWSAVAELAELISKDGFE
jgi:hypothetical protein